MRDLVHKNYFHLLVFCMLFTNVKEDVTVILKMVKHKLDNSRDTVLPAYINYLALHAVQCSYTVKKPVFLSGFYLIAEKENIHIKMTKM